MSSARRSAVPVGLFGLQTKSRRVRSVIAASMASRSCPWAGVFGTGTGVACPMIETIG